MSKIKGKKNTEFTHFQLISIGEIQLFIYKSYFRGRLFDRIVSISRMSERKQKKNKKSEKPTCMNKFILLKLRNQHLV